MKSKLSHLFGCFCFILTLALFPFSEEAVAQEHVVQLSGLVVTGDSATGMAGAAVFVPHTNRGTYTNPKGFFSLPVLPGDSVVVSALGYQRQYLIIPETFVGHSYSTMLQLLESPTELPTVDVMPWATERDLREAVSNLNLPKVQKPEVDLGPLEEKDLTKMRAMDAETNAAYGLQQTMRQQQRRYMVPSDVNLLGISIGGKKKKASRASIKRARGLVKDQENKSKD
ncbi:carboxypeptidase-like regulatory domain-containing protein [Pontibacter anaerobius]|uniref:Carboxypeptidase-like regulatory domain-containing protein n=1 Tax=Pontibacter anaerobius TaxID=2993940 RepID=A0ABT3RAP4_9BACT|nr:carboxypeptidase-like regulatory domain-containing protein [Pontibacter anaerobius]MCX2738585.1 carboxypeptidase-like regulatory domain-containing protein [Pontibacter anaerobius]